MQTEKASVPEAAFTADASSESLPDSDSSGSPVRSLSSLLLVSDGPSVSSPPRPIEGRLLVSLEMPVVVTSAAVAVLTDDAVVKLDCSSDVVVVAVSSSGC